MSLRSRMAAPRSRLDEVLLAGVAHRTAAARRGAAPMAGGADSANTQTPQGALALYSVLEQKLKDAEQRLKDTEQGLKDTEQGLRDAEQGLKECKQGKQQEAVKIGQLQAEIAKLQKELRELSPDVNSMLEDAQPEGWRQRLWELLPW